MKFSIICHSHLTLKILENRIIYKIIRSLFLHVYVNLILFLKSPFALTNEHRFHYLKTIYKNDNYRRRYPLMYDCTYHSLIRNTTFVYIKRVLAHRNSEKIPAGTLRSLVLITNYEIFFSNRNFVLHPCRQLQWKKHKLRYFPESHSRTVVYVLYVTCILYLRV